MDIDKTWGEIIFDSKGVSDARFTRAFGIDCIEYKYGDTWARWYFRYSRTPRKYWKWCEKLHVYISNVSI